MLDEKLIFDTAVAIDDPEERARYLKTACGADSQLQQRVQSLLNAVNDCGDFLQKRPADSFEARRDHVAVDQIGQTIGRYKLLERIGEGGFGDVYMAEQLRPVIRKVALKIIKPGMDSKQVIARFEAERQALALMEHPHIGKFLDAGATDSGRPYFVMELVCGIPVTYFCEKRRLSTKARLRLFVEICGAIEHAHQKGIIHRDLKPTNILVYNNGERPVPKVIDFGIAKATQGRLTEKTLFTQFHQFIGTPAYMSPEQAQMSGVDVDTRSDIYSLGVLLYELLTGRTPLDVKDLRQLGIEETCRRIRDDDAMAPSKRVSTLTRAEITTLADSHQTEPSQVVSRLRGDLDWIVTKALEKDRNDRYKTTDALASDVQRHLDNEPVAAGPPSATYHLRKFLRRNRTAAWTALAFAAVLLLGTVASVVGWTRAVAAKRELAKQVVTTQEALAESNASRNKARAAMERASSERARAVKAAYLGDVQAAHQALQLKNLGLARKLLRQIRELDPALDLQHWEWRSLWAQCQGDAETWFGGDNPVKSLSVHPDGKLVAVGSPGIIRVWGIFTGETVHEFKTHGLAIARFSPDGKLLYTSDETGLVHGWQVPDFEPAEFLLSHEPRFDYRHQMQVAPDGSMLATYSGTKGEITIWDTRTQDAKMRIPTKGWVCPLAFSPDSSQLALGAPVRIVDLQTMEVTPLLGKEGENLSGAANLVFSHDGQHIASAGALDQEFMIHRVSDGDKVAQLRGHSNDVIGLAFSTNGRLFASAALDRTVLLWETRTRRIVAELREHDLGVVRVAFSPDGQRLLTGGRDGKICVWNLADVGKNDWPISRTGLFDWNTSSPQVSCSPDGTVLATTHTMNRERPGVTLLSTSDLQEVRTLAEASGIVRGVLYSPAEDLLVISNQAGALEFITPDDRAKSEPVVFAEGKQLLPVRFTPDGNRLLAVVREIDKKKQGDETTCAVYSVPDRNLIASWSIPRESCLAIAPNGELVVSGHKDGLRFWPLEDLERPTHVLVGGLREGTGALLWSVDFSPDGAFVVAGGNMTGRIEIVDALVMQPVGHLAGHIQHIGAVRFSPDGKRLASGGHTSTDALKIWDFESRREIMSLTVEGAWSAGHIEWSPDGNSIMLLTGDSIISIWRAPSLEEIQQREREKERQ